MEYTDCPVEAADDAVDEGESNYENLINELSSADLLLLLTKCKPDEG